MVPAGCIEHCTSNEPPVRHTTSAAVPVSLRAASAGYLPKYHCVNVAMKFTSMTRPNTTCMPASTATGSFKCWNGWKPGPWKRLALRHVHHATVPLSR